MSFGGGGSCTSTSASEREIGLAKNTGIPVVVAAGNDNDDAANYSPASCASAFTVGSTTSADKRSSFSNYGTNVDIFAPGSSIKAAAHDSAPADLSFLSARAAPSLRPAAEHRQALIPATACGCLSPAQFNLFDFQATPRPPPCRGRRWRAPMLLALSRFCFVSAVQALPCHRHPDRLPFRF